MRLRVRGDVGALVHAGSVVAGGGGRRVDVGPQVPDDVAEGSRLAGVPALRGGIGCSGHDDAHDTPARMGQRGSMRASDLADGKHGWTQATQR